MSSAGEVILQANRVPGYTGRGDKYLGEIVRELRRVLWKTQRTFTLPSCRLPDAAWSDVAASLVEWAEDIHNDLGLWRAVETHQRACLGTPLPMIVEAGSEEELAGFDPRRIQFLLWNLWPCLNPDLIVSPTHGDLQRLAEAASRLLTERFARLPRDSGVKHFLATPNEYGWDIKGKLLWLGIHSYLFRFLFFKYLDDEEREPDIDAKDDFVCTHCTEWSGLGVIDVLAAALDLPEQDRATLRTWYERHRSYFRVVAWQEEGGKVKTITARNVVNGQPYVIRMNVRDCPFEPGMVVFGALTPWRGEWVWSGHQRSFNDLSEEEEPNLRKEALKTASSIAYRYCPDEAAKALEITRSLHAKLVARQGNDLAVFQDGLAMMAAEQERLESEWEGAKAREAATVKLEGGPARPGPRLTAPPEVLDHDEGIGMFSNPDEGQEIALRFNLVLSGLRKKGVGMTEDEADVLEGLVTDPSISPAFIRRLTAEHGPESFAETFLLRDASADHAVEFLLRRHKGHFYRKRYPALSLV